MGEIAKIFGDLANFMYCRQYNGGTWGRGDNDVKIWIRWGMGVSNEVSQNYENGPR